MLISHASVHVAEAAGIVASTAISFAPFITDLTPPCRSFPGRATSSRICWLRSSCCWFRLRSCGCWLRLRCASCWLRLRSRGCWLRLRCASCWLRLRSWARVGWFCRDWSFSCNWSFGRDRSLRCDRRFRRDRCFGSFRSRCRRGRTVGALNSCDVGAIHKNLSKSITNIVVRWACGTGGDSAIKHPLCVGRRAIALSVITAEPHPTEYSWFVGIVFQVWQLKSVINSVVGARSCWSAAICRVIFHIVFGRIGCILIIHKCERRVQTDRLSLPIRDC